MIVLKLKGGLGNQMFQYSFGLNLAKLLSKKLYLDLSYYQKFTLDTKRNFELDNYPIEIDGHINQGGVIQWVNNKLFASKIDERNYDKSCLLDLKVKNKIYVDGYWQGEQYFSGVDNQIRQIFNDFNSSNVSYLHWRSLIESGHSTSLHVRRGDYIHSVKAAMVHSVCGLDFFDNAIKLMRENNKETNFFIFTDDVMWVRENFDTNIFHVVSSNKINHFEELSLMSRCTNNIISNSTFSWWGAWLNLNASKFVICPSRWFKDDRDLQRLIPSTWLKI